MMADHQPDTTAPDATGGLLAPFARDVLLATGRPVRVRPARSDDVAALERFYKKLSGTSSYFRFFGVRQVIPEAELRRSVEQDVSDHVTLVADANGELIAIAEYYARPGGDEAEVAFAVADEHHQEGIATVLLEDLAGIARQAGFRRLVAQTLPDNVGMQRVLRDAGLVHRRWFEDGAVHVELDLTAENLVQDHADLRDWRGAVRSLQPILRPRHVAVIGGTEDTVGPRILANLYSSFDGQVSALRTDVDGILSASAAGLDGLATVPDLAVITVAPAAVLTVVEQCGAAGVPSAIVVTAGFAETGDAGTRLQDEILAAARRHGMRLVGPNSLGVVSTSCGLNAMNTSQRFGAGGIAIASQSGGVGIAIAAEAERRGAGISSFVSMGNKADVSSNDLLRLWADDDATRVVLLYLESFGDPVRFARIARAVAQRKPVIALKGGRSESGARGARSHTAAAAGEQAIVDALFAHTGVIRARTMEELIDLGLLLDRQPTPRGCRVGLVGNAGGPLILAADAAEEAGAVVPVFSATLQDRLGRMVGEAPTVANPVHTGPLAPADRLAKMVPMIASSGEVDACVVICVELDERQYDAMLAQVDELDSEVPIAVAAITGRPRPAGRLPRFPTPERAATAIALAGGRADGDDATFREGVSVDATSLIAARGLARRLAHDELATTWLDQRAAFELLESAGTELTEWCFATSADECVRCVGRVSLPVVLKASVADVLHKAEEGAVRLGIGDAEAAARTYGELCELFGERLDGVIVQSQIAPGLELQVTGGRDAALGPYVTIGAGGVDSELRADRTVLVAPVTSAEARAAVKRLHLAPLFSGFRRRPALPIDPVVDLLTRVAALLAAVPEIRYVDLNPVIVSQSRCVPVDARVALSKAASLLTPTRAMRGATPNSTS